MPDISDYITPREFAEKHGQKYETARKKIFRGRVPGAIKAGTSWLVPKDAEWPADGRLTPQGEG